MRALVLASIATLPALACGGAGAQPAQRLNPVIELLEAKQPVFGLYAPANRRPAPGETVTLKSPPQLAAEALGAHQADYIFDGSMEGNYDAAFPIFAEFMAAMKSGRSLAGGAAPRLTHPLIIKTPEIAPDRALAAERIAKQLNLGVSGIVFVSVESADEVRAGLAAMRFKSKSGTRPDDVGEAPSVWGMSEQAYREKADLWPLNPHGELINFTIVESKAGLENVREIAAVPGIGVLFPGAGTLRGLFTTTDSAGRRHFDQTSWEAAIQQVLAACKEFNVPCGYPANAGDIEWRMQQGFSVFVIGWGEQGFRAVDIGRKVSGRAP